MRFSVANHGGQRGHRAASGEFADMGVVPGHCGIAVADDGFNYGQRCVALAAKRDKCVTQRMEADFDDRALAVSASAGFVNLEPTV